MDQAGPTRGNTRWWLTCVALSVAITGHFIIVLLAIAPVSGMPAALSRFGYGYVEPLFRQGWWFFAPDPPAFEHAVAVRGWPVDEPTGAPTPWVAVTDPLIRASQTNRFAPESTRLSLVLFSTYGLLTPAILPMDTKAVPHPPTDETWERQPLSILALQRIGADALRQAHPETAFGRIQIRLTLWRLPHVSQPTAPLGAPEVEVEFPPVPYEAMRIS